MGCAPSSLVGWHEAGLRPRENAQRLALAPTGKTTRLEASCSQRTGNPACRSQRRGRGRRRDKPVRPRIHALDDEM